MTLDRLDAELAGALQPLSARSVVASALLGTYPPSMRGNLLVAFGERFGISPGTTRVALSRMLDRGELVNEDGVYSLAGPLLDRQRRQDRSRAGTGTDEWDGSWEQAIVVSTGRSASDRARLRRDLTALGLGEVREGVWMRPGNLDPGREPTLRRSVGEHVRWLRATPIDDTTNLVGTAFDLDGWATRARALARALSSTNVELGDGDDGLVDAFMLAAAALRHFVHDPQLPAELAPADWPASELRRVYDRFQHGLSDALARFFRAEAERVEAAQSTK